MRVVTHGEVILGKSVRFITLNKETKQVVTSFASDDGLQNAAHVHLTPDECREYAHQLIIMADKLDSSV